MIPCFVSLDSNNAGKKRSVAYLMMFYSIYKSGAKRLDWVGEEGEAKERKQGSYLLTFPFFIFIKI